MSDIPRYSDGSMPAVPTEADKKCWSAANERWQAGAWVIAEHVAQAVKAERERLIFRLEAWLRVNPVDDITLEQFIAKLRDP